MALDDFKKTIVLECDDEIEEAVTEASRVITDKFYVQNGHEDEAEDHDDDWFDLQERVREAMLDAAVNVLNEASL